MVTLPPFARVLDGRVTHFTLRLSLSLSGSIRLLGVLERFGFALSLVRTVFGNVTYFGTVIALS